MSIVYENDLVFPNLLSIAPRIVAQASDGGASETRVSSILDMSLAGGPVMIPLVICSVLALAFAFERMLRLRARALGTVGFEADLTAALAAGGIARGIELCEQRGTAAARVMRTALLRWNAPFLEREKQVEDAGQREVRALSANLKPLVYVSMLAPLLGFLGTVYGMIVAFTTVALDGGLGKPEMLAAGISQALITTAAGLTIAVPTQVLYYWLKSRVDRFALALEGLYARVSERLNDPTPPANRGATPPPSIEAQTPAQSAPEATHALA